MKIWFVTSEFPPMFGGGIATYIDNVSRLLVAAGHEVTVFVRDEVDDLEETRHGVSVVRFKHGRGERYTYLGYWAALAYQYCDVVLDRIAKHGAPDVIETQDYNAIGYYILLKRWCGEEALARTGIVVHLHTPTFELADINQSMKFRFPVYWIGQMEKFCIAAADALVTQSEFLKDRLRDYANGSPIDVIPLPIVDELDGQYSPIGSRDLLYVGRLEYRKGVVQLLDACEAVWRSGTKFRLKIIGGDTFFEPKRCMLGELLRKKFEHRIEEGVLEFVAPVPPDSLKRVIAESGIVVIPSLYENYPYAALMSLSLGKPLLVSSSGGQAEMIGSAENCGFVFDWSRSGDFQEKLIRFLKLPADAVDAMARNARLRARDLTEPTSNRIRRENVFKKAIAVASKGSRGEFPLSASISRRSASALGRHKRDSHGVKGKLSVIIPFYNLGAFLPETVQSALEAEYEDREIIVVNDGSTDPESLNVLQQICVKYPDKVRVLDIKNSGLALARNAGAQAATGEFLTFLDADDLVDKTFYGKAISILNKYENVSFVYSWVKYFGNTSGIWPTFNTEFPYLLIANMLSAFVVVRRSDFVAYGMNREELRYGMEDYDAWIAMSAAGCGGVSIPEPLVHYRVRTDSMSRQFNPVTISYSYERMSSCHAALYKEYGYEVFNLMVANGPGYLWNNPTLTYPDVSHAAGSSAGGYLSIEQKYALKALAETALGKILIKAYFLAKRVRMGRYRKTPC